MSDFSDLLLSYSPVLYWTLDGSTQATDESTGGHNGAAQGGVTIGGYSATYPPITGASSNTCTDMDGSNDNVNATYSPFLNAAAQTLCGWAYRDASADHDCLIGTSSDDPILRIASGSTDVQFFAIGAPTFAPLFTFTAAWPGNAQWVFWALVANEVANTAQFFVNGVSTGAAQTSAWSYGAANPISLGIRGGASDPFDGKMAHFAIFQSALTAAQISNLYRYAISGAPAPDYFPLKVREAPPLRLSVEVETPNGNHFRWGEDERRPENVPSNLSFSTVMPGGMESMDCTLPRKTGTEYQDLERLSTVRIHGAGGQTAGEYRLEKTPRVSGNEKSISPQCVGWQAHLEDDNTAAELYIDRSLDSWGPISRARMITLLNTYEVIEDPSVNPDTTTGIPALSIGWTGADAGTTQDYISEGWYDAGPSCLVKDIYYDFVTNSATDASYTGNIGTSSDDLTTATSLSADLIGGASASGTGTVAAAAYRFGLVQMSRGTLASAIDTVMMWRRLTVWGNHGLTKRGTAPADGLYASDVIANAIGRWCPRFAFTTGPSGSIRDSAFIIPQLDFRTQTTAAEIVKAANRFSLDDWWVDEGPTFNYAPRNTYGKKWRARVSPANLQETGPSVDRLWNGVVVLYQDVDGSSRSVGPTGSLCDATSADLLDADPENPVNRLGLHRYTTLDMGITSTVAAATEVGKRFLERSKDLDQSGSAELVGHVEDDHGVIYPAFRVRAGDQIAFVDAADPSYRRIVHTSYEHDSRTNSVDLDAPPEGMDALLERLGVAMALAPPAPGGFTATVIGSGNPHGR